MVDFGIKEFSLAETLSVGLVAAGASWMHATAATHDFAALIQDTPSTFINASLHGKTVNMQDLTANLLANSLVYATAQKTHEHLPWPNPHPSQSFAVMGAKQHANAHKDNLYQAEVKHELHNASPEDFMKKMGIEGVMGDYARAKQTFFVERGRYESYIPSMKDHSTVTHLQPPLSKHDKTYFEGFLEAVKNTAATPFHALKWIAEGQQLRDSILFSHDPQSRQQAMYALREHGNREFNTLRGIGETIKLPGKILGWMADQQQASVSLRHGPKELQNYYRNKIAVNDSLAMDVYFEPANAVAALPILGPVSRFTFFGKIDSMPVPKFSHYEPIFPSGSIGSARVWTKSARIKAAQLPKEGKIRFVLDKDYKPNEPILRGPNHGYLDRFHNEWTKGPSRTFGQEFEWDVQLSPLGKKQLGWASRDKRHLNVSLDGRITHY